MRVHTERGGESQTLDVHAGFTVMLRADDRATFSSEAGLDPFGTARAAIRRWREAADFLERWLAAYSQQPADPREREAVRP